MQIKEVRDFCIDVVRYFSDSSGLLFFFFFFPLIKTLVWLPYCFESSYGSSPLEASVGQKTSPTNSVTWTPLNGGHEADIIPPRVSHETCAPLSTPVSEQESPRNWVVTGPAEGAPKLASSKVTRSSSSKMEVRESGRINDPLEMIKDGFNIGKQ